MTAAITQPGVVTGCESPGIQDSQACAGVCPYQLSFNDAKRVDMQDAHRELRDVLFVMATEQEYGVELRKTMQPLICGVGVVEAAISTSMRLRDLIEAGRKPSLVVSLGSAGSRRCAEGELRQVDSVSWRDIDATKLGFKRGHALSRPGLHHSFADSLQRYSVGVTLDGQCGSGRRRYEKVEADLVDMESYAVVRVCQRFETPVVGLRGISNGSSRITEQSDWEQLLG